MGELRQAGKLDHRLAREEAAELVRIDDIEVLLAAAARRRLGTAGPTLLSALDVLDTQAFRLFLALLGDALAARMPGDTEVKTVTSDGTLEVRLSLVPGGGTATIRTTDGLLTGPEHVVEITDLTAS